MNTDKVAVGKRIREARERAGLDQAALGASCGTNNKVISAYENGRAYPPANVLADIAKACSTTTDALIVGGQIYPLAKGEDNEHFSREQGATWPLPPTDFEQRIIGMLRRLPADQRQAFIDLITTAYVDHMENQ